MHITHNSSFQKFRITCKYLMKLPNEPKFAKLKQNRQSVEKEAQDLYEHFYIE